MPLRDSVGGFVVLALAGCTQIPPAAVPPTSATQHQVVVLDIDGTLTPRNIDVFEARPGAAQAVNALVKKGYQIVYITTRIPLYQSSLPGWLRQNEFPAGMLHVAQTAAERGNPALFKAQLLAQYRQAGWQLAYAYGDSSTDFTAYAQAGIAPNRVFALQRRGDERCQEGVYRACLVGWAEHLPTIENEFPVAQ
jgi:phosphatidate phosphatase PAH1